MSNDSSKPGNRLPLPSITVLSAGLALAVLACTSEESPTQPGSAADPTLASAALAVASNTWTPKAPRSALDGLAAGVAPNSAGQEILYTLGGTDGLGGTGFSVLAYNLVTDTWTPKASRVGVWNSNGVGKLGNKLYFSGGINGIESGLPIFTNQVLAYDYGRDRLIRKADLPIFSGEGVTGVINGKLYVLPGACSGERYPQPGFCVEEPTRRFYQYDPATNAWISRRSAPHFHRGGAGGVINGKFYVVGGRKDSQPVADLDVYDPATDTWRTLAPFPLKTLSPIHGAVLQAGLFVISGELRAYFYSPTTNRWGIRASPKEPHPALARVLLNGSSRLLAVAGGHGPEFDIPNDTELYTP